MAATSAASYVDPMGVMWMATLEAGIVNVWRMDVEPYTYALRGAFYIGNTPTSISLSGDGKRLRMVIALGPAGEIGYSIRSNDQGKTWLTALGVPL